MCIGAGSGGCCLLTSVWGKIATWNINYYPTYYKPNRLEEPRHECTRHQEYISEEGRVELLTRIHLNNISAFEFLSNNCQFFEVLNNPPISRQANQKQKGESEHVKLNIAQRKSATKHASPSVTEVGMGFGLQQKEVKQFYGPISWKNGGLQ